jgi:hypothetical protein
MNTTHDPDIEHANNYWRSMEHKAEAGEAQIVQRSVAEQKRAPAAKPDTDDTKASLGLHHGI